MSFLNSHQHSHSGDHNHSHGESDIESPPANSNTPFFHNHSHNDNHNHNHNHNQHETAYRQRESPFWCYFAGIIWTKESCKRMAVLPCSLLGLFLLGYFYYRHQASEQLGSNASP